MSYLTQMAGLGLPQLHFGGAWHCACHRLYSRIAQREKDAIGNFWVDMTRCILWVLLPLLSRWRATLVA
jgi:K+-transporting ATPase ATPase A chain